MVSVIKWPGKINGEVKNGTLGTKHYLLACDGIYQSTLRLFG